MMFRSKDRSTVAAAEMNALGENEFQIEGARARGAFVSASARRRWRGTRAQFWLTGVSMALVFQTASAQTDFAVFWKKFSSAVMAGDKAKVSEMTKFPLSMQYGVKAVKAKSDFARRYDEIFNGEANAAQCFRNAKPQKESGRYEIYCPFKKTPNDKENTPIRFIFELTKSGWKFSGLDNINE